MVTRIDRASIRQHQLPVRCRQCRVDAVEGPRDLSMPSTKTGHDNPAEANNDTARRTFPLAATLFLTDRLVLRHRRIDQLLLPSTRLLAALGSVQKPGLVAFADEAAEDAAKEAAQAVHQQEHGRNEDQR